MSERCTTCTRPIDAPYRRHNERGEIVEGCIAADHDGRLYGESARWHNRKVAKALRAATKKRIQEILKLTKREARGK